MLFVSGTTVGGSGRSQRELAAQLVGFGHEVEFVADTESRSAVARWSYEHLSDAVVRLGERRMASAVRRIERLPGRKPHEQVIDGIVHRTTPIPENVARSAIEAIRPDIVVGSSVLRLTWRKVRTMCRELGIPTILYIREVEALNHFADGTAHGDVVVANAESLAEAIRALAIECAFIPSVVDTSVTRTESTREVVLAINPIASRGVDVVWAIAARRPDVRFVVQESWPLDDDQLAAIDASVARLGNVEFRRAEPPGPRLYGDARVVLVPYRIDNRPRVIPEAQSNAIPVIVGDVPALVEAVGDGGLVAALDDPDAWCRAIDVLFEDQGRYEALSDAALRHSRRPDIDPTAVARTFEELAQASVGGQR